MSSAFSETEARPRATAGPLAVLVATAPATDGGPAAALPWEGTTLLGRLVGQLTGLGVARVVVVTRPEYERVLAGAGAELVPSPSAADDFRAIARAARSARGTFVVAQADVATQREALAGLLADPRVTSGILSGELGTGGSPVRAQNGRLTSAASAYHRTPEPGGEFLGVLKVGPGDLARLAEVADRLAELVEPPLPPTWNATEPGDAAALLLTGLVRSGVVLTDSSLRELFWERPVSAADAAGARERIGGHDEDRALLDSAVKATDGFFTTFFVSPYSRYIARWAARRGLTPNQVTAASMLVGVAAAAAFATGQRGWMVAGALLLQAAFTLDCVDGQLARYTRTFTRFGAWLDSILDRAKEYVVFAGLAIGASRAGDPVWVLAAAALTLQTFRHTIAFSFSTAQQRAVAAAPQRPLEDVDDGWAPPAAGSRGGGLVDFSHRLNRVRGVLWVKRVIAFPIGERFAAISLTAAIWSPRVTFVVLLAWGGFATVYSFPGQVLRTLRGGASRRERTEIELYRDDGPLARALGAALPLPPVALVAAGALPLAVAVAVTGADASNGLIAAVLGWLVVLGGLSAGTPHRDRLRWLVPPLLRLAEYSAIVWIGVNAGRSSAPAAFALLCALAFRHYDLVYRLRHQGDPPPAWVGAVAGGWDGRLILGWVLLAAGALPAGFFAAAAILGAMFVAESAASWARFAGADSYDDDQEDEIQ